MPNGLDAMINTMEEFTLHHKAVEDECSVHVGLGALHNISSLHDLTQFSKVLIVTDEILKPLWLDKLAGDLPIPWASMVLKPGEQQKHIAGVQQIWTALHVAGCDRKSVVINLGGGVVCDMGGFAASTYMRGIDFINIPTTLLAQVDASIGGKTGVDYSGIKNLIGTFCQPVAVIVDPSTLGTLPERQLISGFGEIIKHGLIADKTYFEFATTKRPLDFDQDELLEMITGSCRIKSRIVNSDVTETGSRKLLNFGHTVGHSVEALSLQTEKPLLHGEAVSIGMVVEATISESLGQLSAPELALVKQTLIQAGLPVQVGDVRTVDILKIMRSDKKNDRGQLNFTLLTGIGSAVYDQSVEDSVMVAAIESCR